MDKVTEILAGVDMKRLSLIALVMLVDIALWAAIIYVGFVLVRIAGVVARAYGGW